MRSASTVSKNSPAPPAGLGGNRVVGGPVRPGSENPGPPSPGPAPRPERRKAGEGALRRSAGNLLGSGALPRAHDDRRVRPGVRSWGASSNDPSSFEATPITRRFEPRTGFGAGDLAAGLGVRRTLGSGMPVPHIGVRPMPRHDRAVERGIGGRGRRATLHGFASRSGARGGRFAHRWNVKDGRSLRERRGAAPSPREYPFGTVRAGGCES